MLIHFIILLIGASQAPYTTSDYFPLPQDNARLYISDEGDTTKRYFMPEVEQIGSKEYYHEKEEGYLWRHDNWYRSDSLENILKIQYGETVESLFLPGKLKVGYEWHTQTKSWKYKIQNQNATLTVRGVTYSNLLQVREYNLEIPSDDGVYYSYYMPKSGFICRTRNGEVLEAIVDFEASRYSPVQRLQDAAPCKG